MHNWFIAMPNFISENKKEVQNIESFEKVEPQMTTEVLRNITGKMYFEKGMLTSFQYYTYLSCSFQSKEKC